MKTKQKKELREKTIKQLESKLEKVERQLFDLKMKQTTSGLKDIKKPARLRKQIAVIKTLIREKQLKKEVRK